MIKLVLGLVAVVGPVALGACGGDDGNGTGLGDPVETGEGATYTVDEATVAETEDALYEALGTEAPTTSPLSPTTQSYGPPEGVYVAVEVTSAGATPAEDADQDGEGRFSLLGGDGEEYSPEAFQFDFDVEDITADGDGESAEDEFTSTGIFDIPVEAVEGAQLQIAGDGTDYTIGLGL